MKKDIAKNKTSLWSNALIHESAVIQSGVQLIGRCEIGSNVFIGAGSVVEDSVIGDGCEIKASVIEKSVVKNNVKIGPFAHIRPDSVIEASSKIGNFVEIKNSTVGEGSKVAHLAYVGDADIGKGCNIGCGVIFVNYNGKQKQKTIVEDGCFIGSNCNIIAPVCIAKNSYICAGTTVTKDTKAGDFVIGRAREVFKSNRAKDYLKELF